MFFDKTDDGPYIKVVAGEDVKEHVSLLWKSMYADMRFCNHHKPGYARGVCELILPFHHVRKGHFIHRKLRWDIIKQGVNEFVVNKFFGVAIFDIKCQVNAKSMVHRFIVYDIIFIYKHI